MPSCCAASNCLPEGRGSEVAVSVAVAEQRTVVVRFSQGLGVGERLSEGPRLGEREVAVVFRDPAARKVVVGTSGGRT